MKSRLEVKKDISLTLEDSALALAVLSLHSDHPSLVRRQAHKVMALYRLRGLYQRNKGETL